MNGYGSLHNRYMQESNGRNIRNDTTSSDDIARRVHDAMKRGDLFV